MTLKDTVHERSTSNSAYTDTTRFFTKDVDIGKLKPAGPRRQPSCGSMASTHTARPTWKLRETIEFYRDVLGVPLVHTISARGWGPTDHPDFLHFLFYAGKGATIAFFYYIGTDRPERYVPEDHHFYIATHTACVFRLRKISRNGRQLLNPAG